MNVIRKFANGFFGIALIFFGIHTLLSHFGVIEDKEKKLCMELIESGGTAIATYDMDNSKEVTTKIKGAVIGTSFRLLYSFDADGKKYSGEQSTKALPTALKTRVTYRKSDPSKNIINPQVRLAELNELNGDSRNIWVGIGAMLIGLLLVGRRFLEFKRYRENLAGAKVNSLATNGDRDSQGGSRSQSNMGSATSDNSLPPPPRYRKQKSSDSPKVEAKEKPKSFKRKNVEPDTPATIKREELLANSKRTFKETDHSRFIPPSMRTHSEEE